LFMENIREYGPVAIIFPDTKEAGEFYDDMSFFMGPEKSSLLYFQPYNILPFQSISYHNLTASDRIRVLYRLMESQSPPFRITTIDALMQRIIPKKELISYAELIMAQEENRPGTLLSQKLYFREGYSPGWTIVEGSRGEFLACRGGTYWIFCVQPMF